MLADSYEEIGKLIERWCDRRDYYALAKVLPAWHGHNGMTDGWEILRDSLRHAYAMCTHLPSNERDLLKKVHVDIDVALRRPEDTRKPL